jgi:hypothetical protein
MTVCSSSGCFLIARCLACGTEVGDPLVVLRGALDLDHASGWRDVIDNG